MRKARTAPQYFRYVLEHYTIGQRSTDPVCHLPPDLASSNSLTEEDLHQQNEESSDEEKVEGKGEGLGEGKSSSEGVGNASELDGDRLSGHDLLRIMDWIVAYNELFHKIVEGTDIEKDCPPMEMDADLPKLADNYVRLIRPKFKVWVKNIGKRNNEREKRVRENDAGKLITPAPVECVSCCEGGSIACVQSAKERGRECNDDKRVRFRE